jgi:hypothetical protein
MRKLTGPEILEKWSHIAMRLFPPQMNVGCASGNGALAIRARWKAGNDHGAGGLRGVDLYFPRKMLTEYLDADAEVQVKWDALIEHAISEKLQTFDPLKCAGAEQQIERWLIFAGRPDA